MFCRRSALVCLVGALLANPLGEAFNEARQEDATPRVTKVQDG